MLSKFIDIAIIQGTIRMATPIMLAAMGAMVTGLSGIINIGLEGMMLLGAFFAVVGSYYFGSVWLGVAVALLSGLIMALLFAIFTMKFRAHIILIGITINAFALAITVYFLRDWFNVAGAFSDNAIVGFNTVKIPIIKSIPILGDILSGYTPIVYLSWLIIISMHIILYKTPLGRHLRAVGENAEASETLGIKVKGIKYLAVILSGIFSSLAGAYLSLGQLTMFTENMSANRGFLGLAANIFGMGTPIGGALASLIFGFADSLAMRLQGWETIPSQIVLMIPSALPILILLIFSVRKKKELKNFKEENISKLLSGK